MKLSTKTRYGTRILIELARNIDGDPIPVGDIARAQKIPVKYIEQLVRILKEAEYIKSFRGPRGGHKIDVPPSSISLGDLVRLFEGQAELVGCINEPDKCDMSDECRVRVAWAKATECLYSELNRITIASLLSSDCEITLEKPLKK